VDGVLKANVVFIRREFRRAHVAVKVEVNVQAYRVVLPTGKTHWRRFDVIGHA
jgi:hypothetical protein